MKKIKSRLRFVILIAIVSIIGLISCNTSKNNAKNGRSSGDAKTPKQEYSTYLSFTEVIGAKDAKYPEVVRITDGGAKENPTYHGFFFYNCSPLDLSQFDPTGRYMLGMSVSIEGREVTSTDKGEIGIIDLKDNNKWTRVGQTTAWNWQQGCRLEWIPGSSEELIWDDRSDDGKSFVSRVYNTRTKETRTLPRPINTISPDGVTVLTHDFKRMEHGGTNFVGKYSNLDPGIFRVDLHPRFSPDGRSVSFDSTHEGLGRQIYLIIPYRHWVYPG